MCRLPVATYDLPQSAFSPVADEEAAAAILAVADAAAARLQGAAAGAGGAAAATQPLQGRRPRQLYLIGHSRGAKLSVLAAARTSNAHVAALGLIDPVDATYDEPLGCACG